MEGLNFKNSKRAYLHPKLEQGDHWMIMDVKLDENDMLQFKGQLNVEVGIGAGDAEPNGTFHYNELPVRFGDAKQVYGSYFRDLEGPASGLVRIIFADSPDGPPICYVTGQFRRLFSPTIPMDQARLFGLEPRKSFAGAREKRNDCMIV
ncbi:hypothetical protein BN14_12232 [Rhizoctonia solani AG-1 IB]|uniref:Uncharacterized protein n=1 Tax=Thanatephorus cucumeris (strain AG1-IB / isolate 7/3/14) TaxID=1108050 RepID=M5CDM9_THACB|nr:hypothetical protein BN14_12232 [Rhizoctonia solani AG-1 IB]